MIAKSVTIPEPGIYKGMPDDEYRALPAISKSDLDKWSLGRSIDERNALFGTVFHAAVLEPEIARQKIDVCEARRNSNAWKDHVEASPDKWVLTTGEYDRAVGMIRSIKEHPRVSKWRELARSQPADCEVVAVSRDEKSGVLVKCKIDFMSDEWLYDLKTSGSDPDGFANSIGAFGYGLQAAHYMSIASKPGMSFKGFRFVVANKRKDMGYPCWIEDVTDEQITTGLRQREALLNLFARYNPEHPAVGNGDKQ